MKPTDRLSLSQQFALWGRFRRNKLNIAQPDKGRWGALIFLSWALAAILVWGIMTLAGADHWVWRPLLSIVAVFVVMVTALAELMTFNLFVRLYKQWPIFNEPLWPDTPPGQAPGPTPVNREDHLSPHED